MLKLEKLTRHERAGAAHTLTLEEKVCFISDPYLNHASICLCGLSFRSVLDILNNVYRVSDLNNMDLSNVFEIELELHESIGNDVVKIIITTNF